MISKRRLIFFASIVDFLILFIYFIRGHFPIGSFLLGNLPCINFGQGVLYEEFDKEEFSAGEFSTGEFFQCLITENTQTSIAENNKRK